MQDQDVNFKKEEDTDEITEFRKVVKGWFEFREEHVKMRVWTWYRPTADRHITVRMR